MLKDLESATPINIIRILPLEKILNWTDLFDQFALDFELIELLKLLVKEEARVLNPIQVACHAMLVISKCAACPLPKIYIYNSRVNNIRDNVGGLTRTSAPGNASEHIPFLTLN
jgi:hypothetical protein